MAHVLYPKCKENLLEGNIDIPADTIKIALIDTGTYTYSATHEFYSDISGVVGTNQTLTNKSVTNGIFDADNITYSALTGSTVGAYILYQDTGSPTTSRLISYNDTPTGFPFTPSGLDVIIQWDDGASKIFAL